MNSYEARHASIFESYYSAWGDIEVRAAAVASLSESAPAVTKREARARRLIEQAEGVMRGGV